MAFDFSGSFPGSHWGQPLANPRAPSVASRSCPVALHSLQRRWRRLRE